MNYLWTLLLAAFLTVVGSVPFPDQSEDVKYVPPPPPTETPASTIDQSQDQTVYTPPVESLPPQSDSGAEVPPAAPIYPADNVSQQDDTLGRAGDENGSGDSDATAGNGSGDSDTGNANGGGKAADAGDKAATSDAGRSKGSYQSPKVDESSGLGEEPNARNHFYSLPTVTESESKEYAGPVENVEPAENGYEDDENANGYLEDNGNTSSNGYGDENNNQSVYNEDNNENGYTEDNNGNGYAEEVDDNNENGYAEEVDDNNENGYIENDKYKYEPVTQEPYSGSDEQTEAEPLIYESKEEQEEIYQYPSPNAPPKEYFYPPNNIGNEPYPDPDSEPYPYKSSEEIVTEPSVPTKPPTFQTALELILNATDDYRTSLTPPLKFLVEDASGRKAISICKLLRTRLALSKAVNVLLQSFPHWIKLGTTIEEDHCRTDAKASLVTFGRTLDKVATDLFESKDLELEELLVIPRMEFKELDALVKATMDAFDALPPFQTQTSHHHYH